MYRSFVVTKENRPLGKLKRWWEDNIRIDFKEIGCSILIWIHVARLGASGRQAGHKGREIS
jgi:hypothetical protein